MLAHDPNSSPSWMLCRTCHPPRLSKTNEAYYASVQIGQECSVLTHAMHNDKLSCGLLSVDWFYSASILDSFEDMNVTVRILHCAEEILLMVDIVLTTHRRSCLMHCQQKFVVA